MPSTTRQRGAQQQHNNNTTNNNIIYQCLMLLLYVSIVLCFGLATSSLGTAVAAKRTTYYYDVRNGGGGGGGGLTTTNGTWQLSRQYHANALPVEAARLAYFDLVQTLWQAFNRPTTTTTGIIDVESQLRRLYDTHMAFIRTHFGGHTRFQANQYEILNHYEWDLLERDLVEVDNIYEFFQTYLQRAGDGANLEERALLDISNTVLRNDKSFSLSRTVQDIENVMVRQALYYRALLESTDQICQTKQSPQQFIYSLYTDIALTELKGYTMMEFSWLMLRVYGKGNFTQEAELMRNDYQKRTERTLKLLREVMRRADRIVWRCDPPKYVKGETYDEVTRLLQGYIENEVDLNTDETCRETCDYYQSTRSEGCFKDLYCARQPRCSGKLYKCTYVDADMSVCPAALGSTRRYEFIEYENGRVLGQTGHCVRGTTKVDSWWRYLFWHCSYCFCLCDEISLKSDRYFNLRDSLADVANNKVVTGLRFIKYNRVFHMQIQQGELMPRGAINASSLTWKPVADYKIFDRSVHNGIDYHTLSYESRSLDLDDIYTDDNAFVVTGVRFRVVGAHLNLEARLSEFDFETGKLIQPEMTSFWKSNDNTDVSGERREKIKLSDPDMPTRSMVKSTPNSKHNQYIDFVNSSMDKDAAQTTVPFIDVQDVISNPPVPLSGIGIYHKGRSGYGGFIAPKIMTYDFTPHVQMPTTTTTTTTK